MGSMSWIHWLIVLVTLSSVIPLIMIIRKAGFSAWWVILAFIPVLNFIGLWMLGCAQWRSR